MLKLSAPDALPREAKRRLDELGISLTELSNPALTITEKLKMLQPLMKDNGALMKTFGVENATSALALIQNTTRIDELTKSMYTNGTATDQAEQRTNTLGHAIMELKNSFLGLFTQMGGGGGAMQNVIDSFKFLGANLGTIMAILWKVVRTWLIYKGTMKTIQATQWIMNGGFKDLGLTLMKQIPMTRAYRLEQITLARAQKGVGESAVASGNAMKTAGNSMKAIPWVLIITSLVELYNWWHNVASASAEARRQADLYKQAQENAKQKALDVSESTKKAYDEEIRKSDLLFRTKIANTKSASEKAKLETEMMNAQVKIQDKYIQNNKDALYANQENSRYVKVMQKEFVKLADKASNWGLSVEETKRKMSLFNELMQYGVNMTLGDQGFTDRVKERINQRVATLDANVSQLGKDIKSFQDINDEAEVAVLEASNTQGDYNVHINKSTESFHGAKDQAKEFSTALGEVNDYMQESIDLMQQLDELFQSREVVKMTEAIDKLIEKTKQDAEAGKGAFGLTLAVATTPEEEKATDKANLDLLLAKNTELNMLIDERFALEKKNLEQKNNYAKGNVDLANETAKEAELNKLLEDRSKLLAQEGIGSKDKAKIEADYQIKLGELQIENYQRDEDARLRKKLLDEKLVDDTKKLEDDKVKAREDANKKILDGDKQFHKDVADAKAKADAKELEDDKKLSEEKQKIIQLAYDFYKQNSDKKIALLDAEITASQKQYDHYKTLAENGNINAEQSMAEQQKIITEANKKKAMEEKRQAYMELAKTAYSTYQSKVDAKSKSPLADTIKDITLLQAFIKTIPAFEEGIEDTGVSGRGVDGKGGFHAILHPNERVVPKSLNQQIGNLTNTELANLATNYRAGKIGDVGQTGSALNLAILVNEIKDLKTIIKNKPETNIELGEITASIMEVVQTTTKGNETSYNRFKIRK
jgi:hypothetical protein